MPVHVSSAVYARVSSERQARDNTIASQLAALRQRVAQDGGIWNEELCFVDDGCSGSSLYRPALERLRDAAYHGLFERLYVHTPDRLARRHAHQVLLVDELRRAGVDIVFLNRPIGASAEDELLLQVQGIIAEYERAKIQERSRRGKRYAAQNGAVSVFSNAPYGYRYIRKSPDRPARLEIIAEEAVIVQDIYAWVGITRCSIREVCRRLEKQGIRTRSGQQRWEPATVRGLLRNPIYCGQAAYGKTRMVERRPRLRPQRGRPEVPRRPSVSQPRPRDEWIGVPVPAVIAPELFAAVAAQMDDNRHRHRARQRGGHLLQGLVVCQHCGYACYAQSTRDAQGQVRYGYYRCIGRDRRRCGGQQVCALPTVPQVPLETIVWDDVRALLADPQRIQTEYERRLRENSQATLPQRQQVDARRQRAERAVHRLIDAFAEGLIAKDEFEPRIGAARKRLSEIETEHKLLLERETRDQQVRAVIQHLEQFAERVHQGLDNADAGTRRELICALVKRIELADDSVRIVYQVNIDPFDHGPSGGRLRHWVRRQSAALQIETLPFDPSSSTLA